MMSDKKITGHLVSHTHWDRAWYLPFEKFRVRLVKMIDHLIMQLRRKEFKYFVFDGQMVPFEDYLEIRPENKKILQKYVKSGKLVVGPCYMLPDEYLISPESHVRNLLIGTRMAEEFGEAQKAGYYPDPFGHVSQMPQILNGFGIDTFIFMRGMGNEAEKMGLEFKWQSPGKNGEVMACHQLRSYGNARMLGIYDCEQELYPVDYEKALKEIEFQADWLMEQSRTKTLLFNNGIDHLFAQEKIPQIIDYINEHSDKVKLIHSTFEKFTEDIRKKHKNPMSTWKGEIRSGKFNWILTGTVSARMYLKQMNFTCQAMLEREAEPLSCTSWMLGSGYPSAFMLYAWKTLMKNHPHDDICGCSVDEVHRDMVNRFEHVKQVGEVLIKDARDYLLSSIKVKGNESGIPLVAINTRPSSRSGEMSATVTAPVEDLKKGDLILTDFRRNQVPAKIIRGKKFRQEKFWGERDIQNVDVSFYAQNLPAMGYKTYYIRPKKKGDGKAEFSELKATSISIENNLVKVKINKNGTLNIKDKNSGMELKNVHYFEDCADAGDEYDFSHIKNDQPVFTKSVKSSVKTEIEAGCKATAKVAFNWKLPAELTSDRKKRTSRMLTVPIHYEITLKPESSRIEFRTIVDNTIKDHRLRVVFPTPLKTDHISAESKFDVIDRKHVITGDESDWMQPSMNTWHQENFASLSDGKNGITFMNKGLHEYETVPDKNGVDYHLTLLRSVGWLSRSDLLTRKDHAGPGMETPEAQCIGRQVFEYAVVLHEGDWASAGMQKEAYDYNTPLIPVSFYHQVRDWLAKPSLPEEAGFIQIKPDALVMTAMKKSEDRDSVIIRIYNPTGKKVKGEIDFAFDLKEARLVNLDESPKEEIPVKDGHLVKVDVRSKEIVSVEVLEAAGF